MSVRRRRRKVSLPVEVNVGGGSVDTSLTPSRPKRTKCTSIYRQSPHDGNKADRLHKRSKPAAKIPSKNQIQQSVSLEEVSKDAESEHENLEGGNSVTVLSARGVRTEQNDVETRENLVVSHKANKSDERANTETQKKSPNNTEMNDNVSSSEENRVLRGDKSCPVENGTENSSTKESDSLERNEAEISTKTSPRTARVSKVKKSANIESGKVEKERKTDLNEAKINKSTEKDKTCPYCDFVYSSPRHLTPHLKDAHKSLIKTTGDKLSSYKCLHCEQWCTRPRKILQHMQNYHPEQFTRADLVKTHTYTCTQTDCTMSFTSPLRLTQHLARDHKIHIKIEKRRVYDKAELERRGARVAAGEEVMWGRKGRRKASTLSTKFHKSSRIKDCHASCWSVAASRGQYNCGYCKKTFSYHSVCVGHEAGHETTKQQLNKGSECEEEFTDSVILSEHITEVHKEKEKRVNNKCEQCGKVFTSPWYVKKHVDVVHHKHARYTCKICGRSFRYRGSLTHHNVSRHGSGVSRQYVCNTCGCVLKSRLGLVIHTRRHTGIKPYTCLFCNRCFTTGTHLKDHQRIHTGERPHTCPVCHTTFTNPGSLYNHLYKYAVHGPLPKVRKNDGGVSQTDFDDAVKELGGTGGLKRGAVGARKRGKRPGKNEGGGGNVGLDTLAQVAGMVNGLLSQNEESGELISEHGDLIALRDNPLVNQIQIVTVESGVDNAHINLPDGHQVVLIIPANGGSTVPPQGTVLDGVDGGGGEGVSYIQLDMNDSEHAMNDDASGDSQRQEMIGTEELFNGTEQGTGKPETVHVEQSDIRMDIQNMVAESEMEIERETESCETQNMDETVLVEGTENVVDQTVLTKDNVDTVIYETTQHDNTVLLTEIENVIQNKDLQVETIDTEAEIGVPIETQNVDKEIVLPLEIRNVSETVTPAGETVIPVGETVIGPPVGETVIGPPVGETVIGTPVGETVIPVERVTDTVIETIETETVLPVEVVAGAVEEIVLPVETESDVDETVVHLETGNLNLTVEPVDPQNVVTENIEFVLTASNDHISC